MSRDAAYLEAEGDNFRYRYAVLCGGEAAKRALRTAVLDPSDCDEPGSGRRIALATYADYDDFVYRLPKIIADVTRFGLHGLLLTCGDTNEVGPPPDPGGGKGMLIGGSPLPESGIASRVLSVQRAWVGRRG